MLVGACEGFHGCNNFPVTISKQPLKGTKLEKRFKGRRKHTQVVLGVCVISIETLDRRLELRLLSLLLSRIRSPVFFVWAM